MTDRQHAPAIVVGVDDSAPGRAALRFALEEGLVRNCRVTVVTTWIWDGIVRQRVSDELLADEAHVVRMRQDQILAEVSAGMPRLPAVDQLVLHDAGGAALVEAAKDAAMLVVGSSHRGLTSRTLLGSVSEYCVRHARVPVVVVSDPARVRESDYSDWLSLTSPD